MDEDRILYLLGRAGYGLDVEPADAIAELVNENLKLRQRAGDDARATRYSWDEMGLAMADVVARRAGCVRRQCGAVIMDAKRRVRSTGYNGPPAGMKVDRRTAGEPASATCELDCPRAQPDGVAGSGYDNCISIHAEANALLFCDRDAIVGGTIYATSAICYGCAKLIANSGLARAVFRIDVDDAHREPERSVEFLKRSGLRVFTLTDKGVPPWFDQSLAVSPPSRRSRS